MSEDRCAITELPKSMCGHCKGVDLPSRTDDLVIIRTFRAGREGRCALYPDSHDIAVDDQIGLAAHAGDPREDIGWVCPDCVASIPAGPERRYETSP